MPDEPNAPDDAAAAAAAAATESAAAAAAAATESAADAPAPRGALTLPRYDFSRGVDVETPLNLETAREALRFLFASKSWHDNLEVLHRKVRTLRATLYDAGWEEKARALRAESASRWTFHRIALQLGVSPAQVKALFHGPASGGNGEGAA